MARPTRYTTPWIEPEMPMGAFAGIKVTQVPTHYLQWILRHDAVFGTLRLAVEIEIRIRTGRAEPSDYEWREVWADQSRWSDTGEVRI